ncbi:MAG: stringent starvation protein A [endosymbiont of Galathealinum brachiosum]|uniref:Stringent starvation protein A n=1 Tax=endosymbiont of Galathealinum brachiosum TaxID=2200906 RepID=A0A370D9U9_9GAMM|nr:MAG: stringent starvation protein A [endosymbiont of Galathealinum brachiosum]
MASNALANRRSVMNLFTSPSCPYCHLARIVLAEKDITFEAIDVDLSNPPEDLSELNPYNTVPTLIDRDLVLYDSRVIVEYLDERFPHPPLMPVDPVSRAKTRLALHRVEKDWFPLMHDILTKGEKTAAKARKMLRESIISSNELFKVLPFFLSEDYSLVDATIAPLLWRLSVMGIELPDEAKAVTDYAQRIFEREAFQLSLTETEREMHL